MSQRLLSCPSSPSFPHVAPQAWWSDFQETIKKNKLMKERRVKTTAVGAASISSDSGGKYDFASSIPHLSDEDWKALMGSGTKVRVAVIGKQAKFFTNHQPPRCYPANTDGV